MPHAARAGEGRRVERRRVQGDEIGLDHRGGQGADLGRHRIRRVQKGPLDRRREEQGVGLGADGQLPAAAELRAAGRGASSRAQAAARTDVPGSANRNYLSFLVGTTQRTHFLPRSQLLPVSFSIV